MKNEEVELLDKALALIENHFADTEDELIMQFKLLCDKFRAKNDKEKQSYRDNREYHYIYNTLRRQENPEQAKKYQADYMERKRQKKQRDER